MHKARQVAAALAAAASVTTIVGSALPLFTATFTEGPTPVELTFTPWRLEVSGAVTLGDAPANGFPLVFAAVVLAGAAWCCRSAARPAASPRTPRVAGVTTAVGATFLVCTVWLVAVQVAYWADMYGPQDSPDAFVVRSEISYPAGLWVLVCAALLAAAAAVLAFLPVAEPVAEPAAVDPDAPTPPFGIVLPVAVDEVDPLTGEPVGGPPVPEERESEPPADVPEAPRPEPLSSPAIPLTDDPLAEPRGE